MATCPDRILSSNSLRKKVFYLNAEIRAPYVMDFCISYLLILIGTYMGLHDTKCSSEVAPPSGPYTVKH